MFGQSQKKKQETTYNVFDQLFFKSFDKLLFKNLIVDFVGVLLFLWLLVAISQTINQTMKKSVTLILIHYQNITYFHLYINIHIILFSKLRVGLSMVSRFLLVLA